ncbi:MAG TPA: WYL domain-containing protein [Candidatus Avibacteroides faecavium]|nr:WYL domain-containing protein [Candidatus Avibacteroides faecavium]
MTKDLFDKYIWLVDTIYRVGRITLAEINMRWMRSKFSDGEKIPRRTFNNWRIAIEQVFDITILCDRKDGYVYYIENAEDMEKGGVRNWLLNTFTVNNLINESHHLKRRILFEEIPSGRRFLTPVIEAMRDSVELRLIYQSFWRDEAGVYTLQPYCLKVFRQRWYVTGYCRERDALRTFSLDRIQRLDTLDSKFVFPKSFDPAAFFADSFGVSTGNSEVMTIRIKVYGVHCKYVRALPLHHTQVEVETGNDYSIFEYRLMPTFEFKQEILSRGREMEVIAPQSFRDEVVDEVRQMAANYGVGR